MKQNTNLEYVLIHNYKEEMIAYLDSHPEDFKEAIELAISDKQPFAWRSAWLIWSCIKPNDKRIKPYVDIIINAIPAKNDGHKRELLKIISVMKLSEEQEFNVFDICMELWTKLNSQPSIRWTSMKQMIDIAERIPELFNEIRPLLQEHYINSLSPGVKHSIKKLRNKIGLDEPIY